MSKTNEELVEELDRLAGIYDWHHETCRGHSHQPSCPVIKLRRSIIETLATKDAAWEERMRDAYISGYDAGKHDATTPSLPDQGDSK